MCHDPEIYSDPFVFNPERYLGDEPQRDPRKIVFGFGRRICPGMYLADASLFSCIVKSLAVFSIEKALDEDGVPITPVHESNNGILW
jgi:cytochrome P450